MQAHAGVTEKDGEAHLHDAHALVRGDDEGPQQGVVAAEKGEDRDGNQCGPGHGRADTQEETQVPAAVDAGGVVVVFGQGKHGLAHEENAEGIGAPGDDERGVGVVPAEPGDKHEIGDEGELEGHHHGGEHDAEEEGTAGKAQSRESVAGHERGEHHGGGHSAGDDKGIEEIAGEGRGLEGVDDVAPLPLGGEQVEAWAGDLGQSLEGGAHHPEEGKGGQDRADCQEEIGACALHW